MSRAAFDLVVRHARVATASDTFSADIGVTALTSSCWPVRRWPGLARMLKGQLPVPVVDGVSSAVRHAETLAALLPGTARRGSLAPPPVKPNHGLPKAIEALLRHPSRDFPTTSTP